MFVRMSLGFLPVAGLISTPGTGQNFGRVTASFGLQCFSRAPRPGRPGILPTAAGLRVYPPNQTAAKVIPYPLQACAHNGPVWMDAGPVTPGGPGPGL